MYEKTMITLLLVLAMLSVVGALLGGLYVFVRGGTLNFKYANRFMQARIGLQALALLIFALLLILKSS